MTKTATIRFQQNAIITADGRRVRVSYSFCNPGSYRAHIAEPVLVIYSKDYSGTLPREILPVKNGTDSMTDYFETDRAAIPASHPLFAEVAKAAAAKRRSDSKRWAKKNNAMYADVYEAQALEIEAALDWQPADDAGATVESCEIRWSENGQIDALCGVKFASLSELDNAVADALVLEEPPAGGAYDKTGYLITFTDGITYEGRCDITEDMAERRSLIRSWFYNFNRNVAQGDPREYGWISDEDRAEARRLFGIVEKHEARAAERIASKAPAVVIGAAEVVAASEITEHADAVLHLVGS